MEDENNSTKYRRTHQGSEMRSPLARPPLRQSYLSYNSESTMMNGSTSEATDSSSQYTQLKERRRHSSSSRSSTKSFIILGLIFVASILLLLLVYLSFPELEEKEKLLIKLPKDIEDAKNLGLVLSHYKDKYYYQVMLGFFTTYIFLQSFAIPGSIFLSIISGFLYPFPLALVLVCLDISLQSFAIPSSIFLSIISGFLFNFPLALFLVCSCSCIGASFCYFLSYLVGKRLVNKYFPERIAQWQASILRHKDNLLYYMIFLRITPLLPNWFINITSPVLNVPIIPFTVGTFLGVAPPSFLFIQAGTTLHKLTSSSDAFSWTSVLTLTVLAVMSLLPVFFKRRLQKKFD